MELSGHSWLIPIFSQFSCSALQFSSLVFWWLSSILSLVLSTCFLSFCSETFSAFQHSVPFSPSSPRTFLWWLRRGCGCLQMRRCLSASSPSCFSACSPLPPSPARAVPPAAPLSSSSSQAYVPLCCDSRDYNLKWNKSSKFNNQYPPTWISGTFEPVFVTIQHNLHVSLPQIGWNRSGCMSYDCPKACLRFSLWVSATRIQLDFWTFLAYFGPKKGPCTPPGACPATWATQKHCLFSVTPWW